MNVGIPFALVGVKGTNCPDWFGVEISGGLYVGASIAKFLYHRLPKESDSAFWDRMMDTVSNVIEPIEGRAPERHQIIITCMYDTSSFDPGPAFPKTVFKAKRK